MTRLLTAVLLLLVPTSLAAAEPAQPPAAGSNLFFAMNTGARGGPQIVAPLLEELGYGPLIDPDTNT